MKASRRKLPQAPACESLEGRQFLATGADMGMPPMGMDGPADISAAAGYAQT